MSNELLLNSDLDKYIEKLEKCEYISEKDVKILCTKAKEILSKEDNVIFLEAPITVCLIIKKFHLDLRWYTWAIPWFNWIV